MSEQAKLLIVDDELSVRDSLGKWFREEGYVIGAAENGSQALSLMAENSWDAALVDIKMRGIDGIELQRRMHVRWRPSRGSGAINRRTLIRTWQMLGNAEIQDLHLPRRTQHGNPRYRGED